MKVKEIVKLKSGGPDMTVEWEIGVTTDPNIPFDVNQLLKITTGYDDGDNSCVWANTKNETKKKIFPVEALMLSKNKKLIKATNQNLQIGNVVKSKNGKIMTVNWVIGQNCRPVKFIDVDKALRLGNFNDGDVSCLWFDKANNIKEKVFKANSLKKIYE